MDMDSLVTLTGDIDTFMYTYILIIMLVVSGILFTIRTKGVQIRLFKDMVKSITEQKYNEGKSTASSFQALMISTASRVGTGNIAGVSTAIAFGGPGALMWMWIMATVGAASAFVESTLAQVWKVKNEDGSFRGGPAYYIQQGLGKRWLGIVFAVTLILCFAFGFNALQAYNASSTLEVYMPDYFTSGVVVWVALLIAAFMAICIFGGGQRVSFLTSIIVPIMAASYLLIALIVTFMHAGDIPAVFGLICSSAFDFRSFAGGFAGSVVSWGIKRGLYSNEAGMGSAPNAAAAASVSHPVKQGLVQTFSVFIDTMIICTCTGMMILVFYVGGGLETVVDPVTNITSFVNPNTGAVLTGMPLVQEALRYSLGDFGVNFITFSIFLFAFSSLLGNYYYAESNIRFISQNKWGILIFRVFCVAAVFWGAQAGFDLVWNAADIFMGFQAFVNLLALFFLGGWAIKALNDYESQKKQGLDPVFLASSIPGLPATECWHETRDELAEDAKRGDLSENAKMRHQVEEMLN
ncbi:sodium:alanine symporter family protein [Denitrobacterium detoxificans]|jgi:AGCS family alanine or glycine:cation symporter|uniref:alanine/glycine:cation symporter family protein n=1 Tax=Denitrobacterium detoxificans TaxID=79604 RepID=UPI0026F19129|nr:alanine/glycine:cation symporter family protein [Denitrobacterium detoxificans]MBE6465353.1 alanine:cation symporter family protein [Denitrobacterium detoxificans]